MSKVAEQLTEARQTLLDHNWYPEYLSTCDNHAYCATDSSRKQWEHSRRIGCSR